MKISELYGASSLERNTHTHKLHGGPFIDIYVNKEIRIKHTLVTFNTQGYSHQNP